MKKLIVLCSLFLALALVVGCPPQKAPTPDKPAATDAPVADTPATDAPAANAPAATPTE